MAPTAVDADEDAESVPTAPADEDAEVVPTGSFHAHSTNRIRRDLSDFFKIWCVCKRAPSDMVAQRVF